MKKYKGAWIGSLAALAVALAGCGTAAPGPRPGTDSRARDSDRCPADLPVLPVRGGGKSLVPFAPDRLLLCGYPPPAHGGGLSLTASA